jgi:hypothetical protein
MPRLSLVDSIYQSFSSLFNSSTGIGTLDDPSKNVSINDSAGSISERAALSLYIKSGLIQKIIEIIPTLATECQTKIDIPNEKSIKITDLEIQNHIDRYQVKRLFQRCSISARIFKEAYLLLDITDGKDISEEYIPDGNTTLNDIYFLEFGAIEPRWNRQNTKIINYKIGINTDDATSKYSNALIHPSRVLVFSGKYLTPKMQILNDGYHSSMVEGILEGYINLAQSLNVSTSLISRVATFVFQMNGLRDILKSGDEEAIVQRLRHHKIGIGSTGGLCVDGENEKVEWLGLSLAGIPEIITKLEDNFTATTDISHDMLWNEGSNSTSSDLENINTQRKVRTFVDEHWNHNFNTIAKLICNELLDTTEINFSLELPQPEISLIESISAKEGQARVDQVYINTGVIDAKSVRESRFNTDTPFDTFISASSDFSAIDNAEPQAINNQVNSNEKPNDTKKKGTTNQKDNKVKDDVFQGISTGNLSTSIEYSNSANYQVEETDLEEILADLKLQNPVIWEFATADLDDN